MSLKDTISSAVGIAFDVVKDLSESVVVYRHYEAISDDASQFDATTGGAVVDGTYFDTTLTKFVLADYSQQEIAAGIAGPKDKKLLFPQSELIDTPSTVDVILIDDVTHEIVDDGTQTGRPIQADPAAATWTIRIRKA